MRHLLGMFIMKLAGFSEALIPDVRIAGVRSEGIVRDFYHTSKRHQKKKNAETHDNCW
jgi:hypothetical protein